jgi:hypothetical protein
MKKWGLLLFLCTAGWTEQCQITSPLPVPVLLSGCTYSGSLPSNSTSYIQNTLSPTTTSQTFTVANATVTTNLNVGYLAPSQCLQTDANSNVTTSGSACGSGGGGGSSGIVSPGTFTWINNFGIGVSTIVVSSNSLLSGVTFYQNAGWALSGGSTGASGNMIVSSGGNFLPEWSALNLAGGSNYIQGILPSANLPINVAYTNGFYLSTNTIVGTHAITSTDTIVFASSTLTTPGTVIYTLPFSSNSFKNGTGQIIQITKVDTTTGTVQIVTQDGNLIAGTTQLIVLNAVGQTDELVADGNNGWWPYGTGIQTTPFFLGIAQDGSGSNAMSASSDTVVCPFTSNVPVSIIGWRTFIVSGAGANVSNANFAIYDSYGNLQASSSTVTVPGSGAFLSKLSTPVNLPPGQYYAAMQMNGTATFGSESCNAGNGCTMCSRQTSTTGVLPNPFTFGSDALKPPAVFVLVAGGKTGI